MNTRNETELLMVSISGNCMASGTCAAETSVAWRAVRSDRQLGLTLLMLFLAAGLVAAMSTQARGQEYKVMELNPAIEADGYFGDMTKTVKAYSQARDLSRIKSPQMAQNYFQRYVPIKITQPDAVDQIAPLLGYAQGRLEAAQKQGLPQANKILAWLYSGLKPIAEGNYAPPARINAILAIAKMNEKAAVRGQLVPIPVRFVPSLFLPIYQDATNPDGVRAAALIGLHRYATIKGPLMKAENKAALGKAMDALLVSKAPEGRSEEAHAYLQRYAVDILASMRGNSDPALGKTLVSISTETKNHDLIALHSAAQMASMSKGLEGVKPDKILDGWAIRAMRSFQYEIARLNALDGVRPASSQPIDPSAIIKKAEPKKAVPAAGALAGGGGMDMYNDDEMSMDEMGGEEEMGMMDMMGGGMYGDGPVSRAKQPPEVFVSRRKLNHVLQQLHLGITGSGMAGMPKTPAGLLAATTDAASKAKIEEWVTKMEDVLTGLNDPTIGTRDAYIVALDEQVKELEDLAGSEAMAAVADLGISLPGHSGPVAITAEPKAEMEAVDKNGNPNFPVGLDELDPMVKKPAEKM